MPTNKILILGATGLLGNTVIRELSKNSRYEVTGTVRRFDCIQHLDCTYVQFDAYNGDPEHILHGYDVVINCIGLIKPHLTDTLTAVRVNTLFPLKTSTLCKKYGSKFIHITSDCVFSGETGNYSEDDEHDMIDLYGRTKSLGEPGDCMVLRTSIIGPELHSYVSLLDWVRTSSDTILSGYVNHIWNGITTKQYAKIISQIIDENLYEEGKFHVHSPYPVSKYDLVSMIIQSLNLNKTVRPYSTDISIDRSLCTVKGLNSKLNIPLLEQQVEELN
jgi:dTDP-4-dehydrorhamnose reductase